MTPALDLDVLQWYGAHILQEWEDGGLGGQMGVTSMTYVLLLCEASVKSPRTNP
jgi:hypothetical protein